ncbi:hypothetical protein BROUX41_004964 [Berkeleyomyces rouxiae]|uniref:uncharacterized protein n=1 Tax=Berkeleyomyces rouxiae TaxID=2035830 RepID=UPI003B7BAF13
MALRPATRYGKLPITSVSHPRPSPADSVAKMPIKTTLAAYSAVAAAYRPISTSALSAATATTTGAIYAIPTTTRCGALAARRLSSVPGPLESRRRTGKRHMADIYSLQTFSAPDYNVADLSKWTWLAPTPSRNPSLLNKASSLMSSLAEMLADEKIDYANTVDRVEYADPVETTLVFIETQAPHGMTTGLYRAVQKYVIDFSSAVRLGLCRDDEVVSFTTRAFEALTPLCKSSEAPDILLSSLVEQTCKAMRQSKVGHPQDYTETVWKCLYSLSLKLDLAATSARALGLVMETIPERDIPALSDSLPDAMQVIFKSWRSQIQGSTKADRAANILPFPLLTGSAAQIFSRFSLEVLSAEMLPSLAREIEGMKIKRDIWRMHLCFTAMVSQMPAMRQSMLLGTISAFFSSNETRKPYLPDFQLCNLLIHQWESRGYLSNPTTVYASFHASSQRSKPWLALANLAITISRYVPVKRHVPTMMSLCEALRQQDRLSDLVKSFEALLTQTTAKVHPKVITALTAACNDASVAFDLYKLARQHPDMIHGGIPALDRALSWKMWSKYADSMIKMHSISGSELLTALELRNVKKLARTETYEYAIFIQRVLAGMACQPRFSARLRLHYLDRGLAFLRSRKLPVRKQFIGCFIVLIIRDLRYGHLGRPLRMKWLRKLVRQYLPHSSPDYLDKFIERSHWINKVRNQRQMQSSLKKLRGYLRLKQVLRLKRLRRRYIFRNRRRLAIDYAEEFWRRKARRTESWVLLKNHMRYMRTKLRGGQFHPMVRVKPVIDDDSYTTERNMGSSCELRGLAVG